MPLIIDYTPQHLESGESNPDWMSMRLGRPSSSNASKIVTSTCKISGQRDKYFKALIDQRMKGRFQPNFKSWRMREGNIAEDDSKTHFEFTYNVKITQVGCVFYDESKKFLSSPDGLILEWDEGFETKDADWDIHEDRIKSNTADASHWCQCQMGMLCTGYKAWNYRSYSDGMRPLDIKINRDEKYISMLHRELDKLCIQLDAKERQLRSL